MEWGTPEYEAKAWAANAARNEGWKSIHSKVIPCRYCNIPGLIMYKEWESSCGGHEDYHYKCFNCNKDWWIEGSDY